MKMKRIVYPQLLMVVLIPFFFSNACRHEPIGLAQLDAVCFQSQILPIVQTSCGISGCHEGGEVFSLTNYTDVKGIVSPGNAGKSKFYEVITAVNGNLMPPAGPLSKEQRTLIMVWIQQGAGNTTCSPKPNPSDGTQYNMDTICFTQNIAPIFQSSCGMVNCHDVASHKEGYVLTNYSTIMREGINPFNPSESKLYQITSPSAGEDIMPPSSNPTLTAAQRELLRTWIANGALNSNCPWTTCDTTGTIKYTTHIQPLVQNNCIGCHNTSNASGGVNLSSYSLVVLNAALRNGVPIILGSLKHTIGFIPMPPSGILSFCQIRTVELWINNGMLEN